MGSALNACIYPAYVQGEAYLATKQGAAAAVEFQKIVDHGGIVAACETGVLAHLGLGRALTRYRETLPKLAVRIRISSRSGKTPTLTSPS
jgi:hypothetical protein